MITSAVDLSDSRSLGLSTPRRRMSSARTWRWLVAGGSLPVLFRFVTSAIPSTTIGRRPHGRAISPTRRRPEGDSTNGSPSGFWERITGDVQPVIPVNSIAHPTIRRNRVGHEDGILPIAAPDLYSKCGRPVPAPLGLTQIENTSLRDDSFRPANRTTRRNRIHF